MMILESFFAWSGKDAKKLVLKMGWRKRDPNSTGLLLLQRREMAALPASDELLGEGSLVTQLHLSTDY